MAEPVVYNIKICKRGSKEKLIIKNFGPIKDVELELGRFNVLIGENGTGKSTVAKVLAVCRNFSHILSEKLYGDAFEYALTQEGLVEYFQNTSYISYDCKDYSFQAKRGWENRKYRDEKENTITDVAVPVFHPTLTPKSKEFQTLLDELRLLEPKEPQSGDDSDVDLTWNIPTSFLQRDVTTVLGNTFYIPTQRGLQSIFSIGKNSISNLTDSLFNRLAELDQIARAFKKEVQIEPLDISYRYQISGGFFKKNNSDNFLSLFNAASGYQSAIPIVLLTKHYSEILKKTNTFIIEEPELNLFPVVQHRLMQYLVDRAISFGNSMLLTTHSPYILTSLNNMMYAFEVGQIHLEEVAKITEKKYWLDPNEVSVYRFLNDGSAKNILDAELKQIDAGELDEISRSINDTWDKIADLEYTNEKELK